MLLGRLERDALRIAVDLVQRAGQRLRVAADLGTAAVGLELARTRDRHLDQRGRQRRQDRHCDAGDGIGAVAVLVAAAEEHRHVGQRRDRAGHGRGDGRGQDVAMAHVRQLMRHHAAQLALGQHAQDAGGRRHRGVFRVAAGGEGVRRVFIDQVDARHRQVGALRQLLHHAVELRRGTGVDFLRVVHAQDHLVREPVGKEVHAEREQQRHHHAAASADHAADDDEQRRDGRHQHEGLDPVEHCGDLRVIVSRVPGESGRDDR
ncbi:hypothetical protein D3C81_1496870 [compost metagenome]